MRSGGNAHSGLAARPHVPFGSLRYRTPWQVRMRPRCSGPNARRPTTGTCSFVINLMRPGSPAARSRRDRRRPGLPSGLGHPVGLVDGESQAHLERHRAACRNGGRHVAVQVVVADGGHPVRRSSRADGLLVDDRGVGAAGTRRASVSCVPPLVTRARGRVLPCDRGSDRPGRKASRARTSSRRVCWPVAVRAESAERSRGATGPRRRGSAREAR